MQIQLSIKSEKLARGDMQKWISYSPSCSLQLSLVSSSLLPFCHSVLLSLWLVLVKNGLNAAVPKSSSTLTAGHVPQITKLFL